MVKKYNSNQNWNNDKCWCQCKNPEEHNSDEKDYIWNPAIGNIVDDSLIMCD